MRCPLLSTLAIVNLQFICAAGNAKKAPITAEDVRRLAQDTVARFLRPPDQPVAIDEKDDNNIAANTASTQSSRSIDDVAPLQQQPRPSADRKEDDKNISYDGSDLIEWITNNGGIVHKNARIGLDPTGQYRGVFVRNIKEEGGTEEGGTSDGIKAGEIISEIPWEIIIKPKEYDNSVYWNCEALRELYRQFILGDESKYAPYVNYLKNQPQGRIPSEWTEGGKKLLKTILDHKLGSNGEEDNEDDWSGLPPTSHLRDFKESWIEGCNGDDTPLARAAVYQFTSRDEDTLMVPFYDMHNHSNDPKKLNTISAKPDGIGEPFVLRSTRDILPGEQIYISYNRCNRHWFDETYETFQECASLSNYGTSHLFDVFGFVEDMPQSWNFYMNIGDEGEEENWDNLVFYLEKEVDVGGEERLKVTFGDNHSEDLMEEWPVEENIIYLSNQLMRLKDLESLKGYDKLMKTMPRYEWDMAWRYHGALMTAMSAAILESDNNVARNGINEAADDSEEEEEESGEEDDNYVLIEQEEDVVNEANKTDNSEYDEDGRDDDDLRDDEEGVDVEDEGFGMSYVVADAPSDD